MRFLADECGPAAIVAALRAAGHDVVYVAEASPGATDVAVVQAANRQDRILVTEDYDFGELIVRQHMSLPGLVILALAGQTEAERIARVLHAVTTLHETLRRHITLIGPMRERRRPIGLD